MSPHGVVCMGSANFLINSFAMKVALVSNKTFTKKLLRRSAPSMSSLLCTSFTKVL